jgi:hypothetical protein
MAIADGGSRRVTRGARNPRLIRKHESRRRDCNETGRPQTFANLLEEIGDGAFWTRQRIEKRDHARDRSSFACAYLRAFEEGAAVAGAAAKARRRRARMQPALRRRPIERHGLQEKDAFDGELRTAQHMFETRTASCRAYAQERAKQPAQQTQRRSHIGFDADGCDDGLRLGHARHSKAGWRRSD